MIEPKKFWWMIKKELISLKRHPARLVSILAFPIIMILVVHISRIVIKMRIEHVVAIRAINFVPEINIKRNNQIFQLLQVIEYIMVQIIPCHIDGIRRLSKIHRKETFIETRRAYAKQRA